jgi:hypothetical protein
LRNLFEEEKQIEDKLTEGTVEEERGKYCFFIKI